jgi:hypothetical protein
MRFSTKVTMLVLLLSASQHFLFAQTPIVPGTESQAASSAATVPSAFRGLTLGMSMDEVKAILASDGLFSYRGDIDVSLLPRPEESLIEVSGMSFVRRAFFQFYQGKLFVMIFVMNENEMDHYSLFTSLSNKYGKPDTLSPGESVWLDGSTRLSLERPLAVKYIDLVVFDSLKAAGASQESYAEVLRSEFLGGF